MESKSEINQPKNTANQPKNKRNIHPAAFWGKGKDGNLPTDFDEVYHLVEDLALAAIDWYLKRKAAKSWISTSLRLGAILFTALGGLFPILAGIEQLPQWLQWLGKDPSQYGYIALALAATCLGLDHFFGFSTAWMRFMTTQFALQKALAEFQIDWIMLLKEREKNPDPAQEKKMLERLKAFRLQVLSEIEKETLTWVEEFKSNLKQLEEQAEAQMKSKDQSQASRSG